VFAQVAPDQYVVPVGVDGFETRHIVVTVEPCEIRMLSLPLDVASSTIPFRGTAPDRARCAGTDVFAGVDRKSGHVPAALDHAHASFELPRFDAREDPVLAAEVLRGHEFRLLESGRFSGQICQRRRLKDCCLAARKMSIAEILISRTLTVCGEVAEWPKAAVC
jgi:hypothetical protein